ncbi:MAG: ABC transporter permease [Lachnospiraceae bacterium]|jgi:ribose/xylose/arabinose/galactoside ABC-type transport system permease subunit|nr:ABC transporter permease [Lachnospiraceae bacterium]
MNKTKQDTIQLVKKYSAVTMLLFFVLLNSLFTPNFFRLSNLNNIITQICPTILCGMGMTLVISTGGIDISVGSVMALSGVLTAQLMSNAGLLPAVLVAVIVSVLVGCFTGFMVGKLRLQAMVITLGLQLGLRGVAQVLCGGRDIYFNKLGEVGKQLSLWGTYKIGGVIPVQIVPIVLSIVVVWVMVEKTVLGRQIEAVGDSLRSSILAGIHASVILMIVYGISAFFAAFAGIFQAAKVSVAAGSSLGQLAELDAIAAVVIGGTPMSGGKARVMGTVVGALMMQMITLTCVMNNIPDQYAQVFKAAIIVFAVFIQREQAK